MTITHLERRDGTTITRTGTSGFTVTSTRVGESVDVQMEFDTTTRDEMIAMVGMLLAQLDELQGEIFVAQCVNHYAEATGKPRFKDEGRADLVMIRGRKSTEERRRKT